MFSACSYLGLGLGLNFRLGLVFAYLPVRARVKVSFIFLPLYQFYGALGGGNFCHFTARRHLSPHTGCSMVIVNYCIGVEQGRDSVSMSFGINRILWPKLSTCALSQQDILESMVLKRW